MVRSLSISVARALHGLGVQTQRHVVDERRAVDLGEVDAALATRHQRVQRAHHVVTVDAEVQGEVVACPRRDAGERQVVLGRDLGHQRLRAVASGRRQGVRSGSTAALGPAPPGPGRPSSIGSMPRARASSARFARSALPPPERGFTRRPGGSGRSAAGSATRTEKARPARTAPRIRRAVATSPRPILRPPARQPLRRASSTPTRRGPRAASDRVAESRARPPAQRLRPAPRQWGRVGSPARLDGGDDHRGGEQPNLSAATCGHAKILTQLELVARRCAMRPFPQMDDGIRPSCAYG